MGGCCSANSSDAQTELATANLHPLPPHGRVSAKTKRAPQIVVEQKSHTRVSEAAVQEFFKQAANGLALVVLLASGHGIECTLRVHRESQNIEICRDELVKTIPFNYITRVLASPPDLARVKTEAALDDHCAALLMERDSTCLVFSFDSIEEKEAFVLAALRLLQTHNSKPTS